MNLRLFLICLCAASTSYARINWEEYPRIQAHLRDQLDCGDGNKVNILWQCDGDADCPNAADENDCGFVQAENARLRRHRLLTTIRTEYPELYAELRGQSITPRPATEAPRKEVEKEGDTLTSLRNDVRILDAKVQNLTAEFSIMKQHVGLGIGDSAVPRGIPATGNSIDSSETTEPKVPRPSDVNCGGVLTSLAGNITSPLYPERYPHNVKCTWQILAPVDHQITLTFDHMDLEEGKICFDKVSVHGGPTQPVTNFCGALIPMPIKSLSNTITVEFISDDSISRSGFSVSFLSGP